MHISHCAGTVQSQGGRVGNVKQVGFEPRLEDSYGRCGSDKIRQTSRREQRRPEKLGHRRSTVGCGWQSVTKMNWNEVTQQLQTSVSNGPRTDRSCVEGGEGEACKGPLINAKLPCKYTSVLRKKQPRWKGEATTAQEKPRRSGGRGSVRSMQLRHSDNRPTTVLRHFYI